MSSYWSYILLSIAISISVSVGLVVGYKTAQDQYKQDISIYEQRIDAITKREYQCAIEYGACVQVESACRNLVEVLLSPPKKQSESL